MYFANLKSGKGSCIAPKTGLARPPENGMSLSGILYAFWFEYAGWIYYFHGIFH